MRGEEVVGDEISVEVTSDRPDLFSTEGIARAIRFYLGAAPPYAIDSFGGSRCS